MDKVSGLVVFLLGVAIMWQGRHLSIGNLHAPGPGFFPMLTAAVLVVLSVPIFVTSQAREAGERLFTIAALRRVVTVFVALLGYYLLLEYLGFPVVSFLLMAFFFIFVARYRIHVAIFWAFVSTGLAYLLFEILLKSNLPKGIAGF